MTAASIQRHAVHPRLVPHVRGHTVAVGAELVERAIPDRAGIELAVQWIAHQPKYLDAAL